MSARSGAIMTASSFQMTQEATRATPTASNAWYHLRASLCPKHRRHKCCNSLVGPDAHSHCGGNVVPTGLALLTLCFHNIAVWAMYNVDRMLHMQILLAQCMHSSCADCIRQAPLQAYSSTANWSACKKVQHVALHGRAGGHSCNARCTCHLSVVHRILQIFAAATHGSSIHCHDAC